jgi:hypothetical protein
MGMEPVPETLYLSQLTRLIALEDYIEYKWHVLQRSITADPDDDDDDDDDDHDKEDKDSSSILKWCVCVHVCMYVYIYIYDCSIMFSVSRCGSQGF